MKDLILIFDLHNTIYDEVMEYGGAMVAAMKIILDAAAQHHIALDEPALCAQIAQAHAKLGSDWDEDVFSQLPIIKALPNAVHTVVEAQKARTEISKKLTKQHAYKATIATLRQLAADGARIYLATEATANAAAAAVRALRLDDGTLTGIYSWPYAKDYEKLARTPMHDFPANPHTPGRSLEKPHPLIIAAVMLDEAKRRGLLQPDLTLDDVFSLEIDLEIDTAPLALLTEQNGETGTEQVADALNALRTRLTVQPKYKSVLGPLWQHTFFIGDSFFKDGFLARNAEIAFIFAKYGKRVHEEMRQAHEYAMQIMIAVTGWNKTLLRLTQETGNMPEFIAAIKPAYTCAESIEELIPLLRQHNEQSTG